MAKPDNWSIMDEGERRKYACELMASLRGRLIMGQALALAVKALREVQPSTRQEHSNIEDMETIGEMLFQPFFDLYSRGDGMIEDEVEP